MSTDCVQMQGPDTSGWTSVYDMRLSDVGVVQIDVSCCKLQMKQLSVHGQ